MQHASLNSIANANRNLEHFNLFEREEVQRRRRFHAFCVEFTHRLENDDERVMTFRLLS
jgi:hypothetical protein